MVKFADSLLCAKSIPTPAILHGIKYESFAVCKAARGDMVKFADSLLCTKSIPTPAILHGIEYESFVEQEFGRMYDFKTFKCGL